MNGLIEDATGGTSTLRLSVLAAVGAGLGIIGCGLYGFLKEIKDSTIVIGAGQALIIAALTLKVWQRSIDDSTSAFADG